MRGAGRGRHLRVSPPSAGSGPTYPASALRPSDSCLIAHPRSPPLSLDASPCSQRARCSPAAFAQFCETENFRLLRRLDLTSTWFDATTLETLARSDAFPQLGVLRHLGLEPGQRAAIEARLGVLVEERDAPMLIRAPAAPRRMMLAQLLARDGLLGCDEPTGAG